MTGDRKLLLRKAVHNGSEKDRVSGGKSVDTFTTAVYIARLR
jgi:hypothetical protein